MEGGFAQHNADSRMRVGVFLLQRVALGAATQHATAREGHNRLMLTKAIDLSARLKCPIKLPITPEDEKRLG